uniref:Uncharacterized protein n=1 Tax=Acrobeloides nanus TaxID=290746 RepID=A0A914CWY3_9BILA
MINLILRRKKNSIQHANKEQAAHKSLQEKLFLIQNFGNLATFVILFIPHMVYAIGCNYDRFHCITGGDNDLVTLIYHISILLFLHNSRVAIWRFFDE